MPDQKKVRVQFKPQQAYLEMARSVLNLPVCATPEARVKGEKMTPNTLLGLVSLAYVFSFLAIEAFINECLYEFWTRPGSRLPQEYPTFEDLLRHPNLSDLKRRIVWACDMYGIEPLPKVDSQLWMGFCQVLRDVRHFLTHPSPEPESFQRMMELATQKKPFGKPVSVAEGIIREASPELGHG